MNYFFGGTDVAFVIKQDRFTPSSLFSLRPASCSRQLILGMEVFLPKTSLLLNTLRQKEAGLDRHLDTSICESTKLIPWVPEGFRKNLLWQPGYVLIAHIILIIDQPIT